MIICDHCLRARLLTVIGDCEPYVSRKDINWDDISTIFQRDSISTKTISQQYFTVQRYPTARYFNSIAQCTNIHKDNISTIHHYYTTISTVTIFQQCFTVQQNPLGQYFKASAPATNQEQQSTDLAFGKIQVPRRNWFGCTYVHTQISMVKLKRSKIYSFHGLCQLKRYILG